MAAKSSIDTPGDYRLQHHVVVAAVLTTLATPTRMLDAAESVERLAHTF